MEFEKIMEIRQSTRKFGAAVPDEKTLMKIIDAGRRAPTAKNLQPERIYIAKSKDALAAVDKASPCRYGAPEVLIICTDKDEVFKSAAHSTSEIDASIVATHIMLAATDMGVDSIWVDLFDRDILISELNLPENILPVCLMPIGYRADDCPVSRNFHNRRPIEEIIKYI